jgi:hypothetical protein
MRLRSVAAPGAQGFGVTKHGRSGQATQSPRFRFLQKLEAQKNDGQDSLSASRLAMPRAAFRLSHGAQWWQQAAL